VLDSEADEDKKQLVLKAAQVTIFVNPHFGKKLKDKYF
jgi:hypothetical protein